MSKVIDYVQENLHNIDFFIFVRNFKYQKTEENSAWNHYLSALVKLSASPDRKISTYAKRRKEEAMSLKLRKGQLEDFWLNVEIENAQASFEAGMRCVQLKNQVVDAERHHRQFSRFSKCSPIVSATEENSISPTKKNLNLNEEIDNFFQSYPEQKSTKKRSNEQGSSEADNEKDKDDPEAQDSISISEEDDDLDYTFISKQDDDSDYEPSDVEDPPPLLTSSQFKCFDESYAKMKKTQKWILSSGTCVEDVIFEYCKELSAESLLHSWIIDLDDQEAENLFTNEEWLEIRSEIRKLPKVDETFVNSMLRFANVKTTGELRNVLETTSYRNLDEPYERENHYDAEWVDIVMRKYLTDYEDPNGTLHRSHLESWHDINVWSLIIDHGLRNLIGIETVRKESSSEAVSARKNRKRVRRRRKNIERKKMGSRMDGIFRAYVNDVEYGVIEVAKKFDETKLFTDGYKL
ncbi:20208_t:CDS:2, partial [Funneliformis geosporum]